MKKYVLLLIAVTLMNSVFAQKEPKRQKDKILANRIYTIEMTEVGGKKKAKVLADEVSFKDDKLNTLNFHKEHNFPASHYSVKIDSSGAEKIYSFESNSKSEQHEHEALRWEGTITGDSIAGNAQWMKDGALKKEYSYTGTWKNKKKGKK